MQDGEGIIWVESGTNAKAVNHTATCGPNGERAVGLMQVCQVHCGKFGLSSDLKKCTAQLQNPFVNVKVAKQLFDACGGSFKCDWPTYSGGAYQKFKGKDAMIVVPEGGIGGVLNDVNDAVTGTASGVINGVKDAATAVPKLIGALFDPSTYLRIGKGALGGVFIIAGTGALVFIVANKVTDGGATKAVEAAAVA